MQNQEWVDTHAASLSNKILEHMAENELTIQVLNEAISNVKRVFDTDAALKKADICQPED